MIKYIIMILVFATVNAIGISNAAYSTKQEQIKIQKLRDIQSEKIRAARDSLANNLKKSKSLLVEAQLDQKIYLAKLNDKKTILVEIKQAFHGWPTKRGQKGIEDFDIFFRYASIDNTRQILAFYSKKVNEGKIVSHSEELTIDLKTEGHNRLKKVRFVDIESY